jgi:periplasmic protein TonB
MEDQQRTLRSDLACDFDPDGGRSSDLGAAEGPAPGRTESLSAEIAADAGNVIVLDTVRRQTSDGEPSTVRLGFGERPAPPAPAAGLWFAVLLVCSLAAHAGVIALFNDDPEPLPSVGVVSLSVELVVGTDLAAGAARTPSPNEVANAARPPGATADPAPPETSPEPTRRADTPSWVDQVLTLRTPSPQSEPDNMDKAAAEPTPGATVPHEMAKPRAEPATEAPVNPRPDVPRPTEPSGTQDAASLAGAASSGIGRGASNADATYPGIVAARLARFKQYPGEARARGHQGTATVTFTLDGDGQVTQIVLAKKSGIASLDRESQAMVRRAAPFPPTPTGGPMSFTVPVDFKLR